jgi:hypothetical protein
LADVENVRCFGFGVEVAVLMTTVCGDVTQLVVKLK